MISKASSRVTAGQPSTCRPVVLVLCSLGFLACDAGSPTGNQDPPPAATGALTVDVVTTGQDMGDGYVLSLDGQPQTVTPNQSVSFPNITPGPHVVELRDEDYNCRVTEQPRGPVPVTAGQTVNARFTVECRVKEIVFISGRDGNFEAYWSSVSGDGQARFMELPSSKEDELAWSPDGSRIAGATDLSGEFEIFTVDRLGGNMVNLTNNPAAIEGMPTWSPDGSRIAYRLFQNGNEDIWVMNADGTGQSALIASPARERLPQWSPDGQSIAYVSNEDGSDDVWVLDLATNTHRRLTPVDDFADEWPSWSPDGQYIAFASNSDGNVEVYVMAADGSGPVNLTQAPGSNEWLPTWSPDGKYISFNTDRHGNLDIYWMKSDGSGVRQITDSPAHDFFATWNPAPWPN